jgi:hypothetical protein
MTRVWVTGSRARSEAPARHRRKVRRRFRRRHEAFRDALQALGGAHQQLRAERVRRQQRRRFRGRRRGRTRLGRCGRAGGGGRGSGARGRAAGALGGQQGFQVAQQFRARRVVAQRGKQPLQLRRAGCRGGGGRWGPRGLGRGLGGGLGQGRAAEQQRQQGEETEKDAHARGEPFSPHTGQPLILAPAHPREMRSGMLRCSASRRRMGR